MIDAEQRRAQIVEHLVGEYLGPAGGESEWIRARPDASYLVGTLYPTESLLDEDVTTLGIDETGDSGDPVIESANAWRPSTAALSFVHDGASLSCVVSYGTYSSETIDGIRGWRRRHHPVPVIELSESQTTFTIRKDGVTARVSSRWRRMGDAWLVTVAIGNERPHVIDTASVVEDSLYQVHLAVSVSGGSFLPYRTTDKLNLDREEEELALRYRAKESYAVGHGTAVDWIAATAGTVTQVHIEPLPRFMVPAVDARESDSEVMGLDTLSRIDVNTPEVTKQLFDFVAEYTTWLAGQGARIPGLTGSEQRPAQRIVDLADVAASRMRDGVSLLQSDQSVRSAFSLAMVAMREQMLQSRFVAGSPANPRERDSFDLGNEPKWRPFQLGFLLLCLTSTLDADHKDRDLVDLIWFPTGGGKTEAYLGLAAIEIFHRRLTRHAKGAGTAVLTRYTLRLLTTQQFQRAATLICAMELMRGSDPRVIGMNPFSIGLWVGNDTTPGTVLDAKRKLEATRKKQEPDNPFQLEACPWCGTSIMPATRRDDPADYGVAVTADTVVLRCRDSSCPFTGQLPVEVIDERIFDRPPTIVLATVDKFARLPFSEKAGALLGRGVAFDPPSLVIQDELHLLSGPLGTTVGIYESAILGLIGFGGSRPKIVASTATIRAADEQILGLFAREVALYPPAGIDEEDNYFAVSSTKRPGRLYLGLMPQAFTQSTSLVRALTPLLEAPFRLGSDDPYDLDAYWTVVAYHNSLRELGRTVTIVRDDVESLLRARAGNDNQMRHLRGDGLVELTSRIPADELPKSLARLGKSITSGHAVDVVASTNMLSVGIDVPRLAVMLMNGQPKTTSEYIQATSRVGRGHVPGIVVTLFRATKPRDRSHYETFRAYHESLYRSVEPTSVTPWSLASRERSLAGVFVAFVRHATSLRSNNEAGEFELDSPLVKRIINELVAVVELVDIREAAAVRIQLTTLAKEWASWAMEGSEPDGQLAYQQKDGRSLTKVFGETRVGWPVMNSMRNVDRTVQVRVKGEEI